MRTCPGARRRAQRNGPRRRFAAVEGAARHLIGTPGRPPGVPWWSGGISGGCLGFTPLLGAVLYSARARGRVVTRGGH